MMKTVQRAYGFCLLPDSTVREYQIIRTRKKSRLGLRAPWKRLVVSTDLRANTADSSESKHQMIELRSFNENGIASFEEYLTKLASDSKLVPPLSNLVDIKMTALIPGNISVDETRTFPDKMEAAKYLHQVLSPIGPQYNIRT